MVIAGLVGRTKELSALTAALEAGRKGRGSVHLVTGEGGIGKTRLTAEVAARAKARGFTTLIGRSFPVETGIPYALFADAFVPVLREMAPASLQALTRGATAELGLLFPTLRGESIAAPRGDPAELKPRLLDTFAGLLERLAARQPILLILENLQWADPSSVDLFHFVARKVAAHPLVLVVTYNDAQRESNRGLVAAERSLASLGVITRHPLGGLTAEETASLVGASFGVDAGTIDDFAQRIHARTRGNAFFIEESLKALVVGGALRQEGERWVGWTTEQLALPDSIRDALGVRFESLSEGAKRLVQIASAVGTHVPHALLVRIGGLERPALLATIDELRNERLFEETEGAAGPTYLFTHPMLQEMLYAEMSLVRRSQLHGEIADALETEYGASALLRAEELAVHFRRAEARTHRDRTVRYLVAAGKLALDRGANREAADSLEAAVALVPEGDGDSARDGVVDLLARARNRLGDYPAAMRHWGELARRAEARGDHARAGVVSRHLGVAAARSGDVGLALEHFARGVVATQVVGDLVSEASLLLARSSVFLDIGRGAEAETGVRRALEIAETLGEAALLARAHQAMQNLAVWQGPSENVRRHGGKAREYARACGDLHTEWSTQWTNALHAGLTGDSAATGRDLAESLRLAEELRSPLLRFWTAEVAIEYRSAAGQWDEALALADRTIAEAQSFRQRHLLPRLLTWSALIHLGRGEFDEAKVQIDEAWHLSGADRVADGGPLHVHSVVPAHVGLGFYHYYRADYRTALEVGRRGLEIADRTGYTVWAVYRLLPLVAECHMRLFEWEPARAAAARLREAAERLGHPLALAWADACDAIEMRFTGDRAASVARLRTAVESLEAIPYAEHAARLRRRMAEPLIEIGDVAGADAELRRAFAAFAKLGALVAMEDCRERIRQIGKVPPPMPTKKVGFASLTATEAQVARLVEQGLRDREIAAHVHCSVRTVGTHLRNIFRKLDLHRRAELAKFVRELPAG
jgi:DNA-binding CsgD family transcriptional regulator